MIKKSPKLRKRALQYGALVFVDLLGFSNKVAKIKTDDELLRTWKDVSFVQEQFEVRPTDKFLLEEHKMMGKKVRAFSDCLVVTVPLQSEYADVDGYFDLLMQEISDVALSQGSCVCRGIFLRGGVELDFWYEAKDVLLSPALVRAATMEKDVCVPMIAIGDEYYKNLSRNKGRYYYASHVDPIASLFRRFDIPGTNRRWWLIDYIPICLVSISDLPRTSGDWAAYKEASSVEKESMRSRFYDANIREWLGEHRGAVIRGMNSSPNKNVREKYVWLAGYHNGAVKRFFRKPDSSLLIAVGKTVPVIMGRKPPRKPSISISLTPE